jgi:Rha family phage regulatory protein
MSSIANTCTTRTEFKPRALVEITTNGPMTTSRIVAEHFGRLHNHVLRDIKKLHENTTDKEFTESNFGLSEYADPSGRKLPEWHMTEDGFAALALAFTGVKAANLRVEFIKAFRKAVNQLNAIERKKSDPNWLLERQRTKDHMTILNEILVQTRAREGKQTSANNFINEARLVAHAFTGVWNTELNRGAMSEAELKILDTVVRACIGYIVAGDPFEVRKANARVLAIQLIDALPVSMQGTKWHFKVEGAILNTTTSAQIEDHHGT